MQAGGHVIFFAHSLFRPLNREVMVAGVGFHPVPIIPGALAEHFFVHHREAQNLTDEIHHLLGSRQTAQVAVNDDAVEAVIDEGQQVSE